MNKIRIRAAAVLFLIMFLLCCAAAGGCSSAGEEKESQSRQTLDKNKAEEEADGAAKEDKTEEDRIKKEKSEKEKTEKTGKSREKASPEELRIRDMMSSMTVEEKVSQLFIVRPEQLTGVDVAIQAGETTRECLANRPVGGIIYFKQNIIDEQQLRVMIENTKSYSKYPIFIAVDEEGGTLVSRIANHEAFSVEDVPDMQVVGASGDYNEAYRIGQTIGSYLHELGFNLDFAPVADVLTDPDNTAIGVRSFGPDPLVDAEMTACVVRGLKEQGVNAVLKHFPGHGGTVGDSHWEAVSNERTLKQLQETEFVPFTAGIEAGAECVMAGHIMLPQAAGDGLPATLSPAIITDILRGKLGFDGVVITDSMRMEAITNYYSPEEAAVRAIQAGVDMILEPEDFDKAYTGILNAVQNGTISEERIDESVYRILLCKSRC